MVERQKPHPSNAMGDFYVVDGCCTSCGVPEGASETFAFAQDGHCFVCRQPATDAELEKVLKVVRTQELDCIRYGGSDLVILRRLAEAGEVTQCDVALDPPVCATLRNHVFFNVPIDQDPTVVTVLDRLRTDLLDALGSRARATDIVDMASRAHFTITWFEERFHTIDIEKFDDHPSRFRLHHNAHVGLSELIHDALCAAGHEVLRWSASASGANGNPRPW